MTAPLPLRFYNPVKELCTKANLDYETVIGKGLSSKMREVYILADIAKPLEDIKSEDKKYVKHKKDFLDKKYGSVSLESSGTGEIEDKGRERYDAGIIVEPVCADDCEVDKPDTISHSVDAPIIKGNTKSGAIKWIPGKGLV